MRIRIKAISDKGCVRENNEDMVLVGKKVLRDDRLQSFLEIGEEGSIFMMAVADGMGGANAGEVASQIVLESLKDGINRLPLGLDGAALKNWINSLCKAIHQEIVQEGINDPEKRGMGTTLAGLLYYEGCLLAINAGDSRIYRFRNGTLRQISRDHSLRELSGNRDAPGNVIVNSFGGGNAFYVDVEPAGNKVLDGDVFLLCSDGVSDMLSDEEIEDILAEDGSEDALLEAAKNRGGEDNISYVMSKVSIGG